VFQATPKVHDLIGELNDVLGRDGLIAPPDDQACFARRLSSDGRAV